MTINQRVAATVLGSDGEFDDETNPWPIDYLMGKWDLQPNKVSKKLLYDIIAVGFYILGRMPVYLHPPPAQWMGGVKQTGDDGTIKQLHFHKPARWGTIDTTGWPKRLINLGKAQCPPCESKIDNRGPG